jgi:hypothetical protein
MKKLQYIYIPIILLSLLTCKNDKKKELKAITIDNQIIYPVTELSPLFDSLRPQIQSFKINSRKDTLIVGINGTTLFINKNTFVNAIGEIAENPTINLIEVNSISEIILSNLQTISDGEILQTAGMFFIDAKDEDEPLTIAAGKSIYVDVKAQHKDFQMKVFRGEFDKNAKINWVTTDSLENSLVSIPINLINFNNCAFECSFSKKQVEELSSPKFENTYISTREFEDRCCIISTSTCDWYNGLSQRFLDIYMDNTSKPIYYSDSLVVDYLVQNYNDKIDLSKEFSFDETGWTTYMFKYLSELRDLRQTNTIDFKNLGINENSSTEDLISKGYSNKDAEKYISLFRIQTKIINDRKTKNKTSELASYSFSLSNLGWTNVDRFIDNENAQESTFTVQINSDDNLDYISTSLIMPNYRIAISALNSDNNIYSFTKKDSNYRKLPIGEDGIIIAFSYKDEQPYFGTHKFKIPKNGQIELELSPSSEIKIKEHINNLSQ